MRLACVGERFLPVGECLTFATVLLDRFVGAPSGYGSPLPWGVLIPTGLLDCFAAAQIRATQMLISLGLNR